MRLSPTSLAALVVPALFPVLLSAQVFPPNADLSRSISLLTVQTQVKAMTVDATGNVYLAGITSDGLTGATTTLGPRGDSDLFIIKTNGAGDQILYATTIGGSFSDSLTAIRVDVNGNLYVLGSTTSLNFPFTSTVTPSNPVGAFILKLNSTGTAITYARQLGSRMNAQSFDIDAAGAAYISGVIISADLTPTAGVIKPTPGAGVGADDATGFIAKLGASGQSFDIATYFGALNKGVEFLSLRSNGVLVLSNGTFSVLNTSLTQQTASIATDLSPVRAAFDANGDIYLSGTSPNGFALRKHAAANLALLFDRSYPLSSSTVPPRVAVAPNGRIFLFGQPFSPNFATLNATQACLANIAAPNGFAGLALGADGSLIGALGSIPPDQALMILDANGNVLHSTFTTSAVAHAVIAPSSGRVYTSVVQTLFTQPDVTYWRGIVRFNQDQIPAEKASPSCIVLGAGTYAAVPLSPGAFMAVYGNHIGTPGFTLLTELTPAGLLPTVLGGASVTVDGRAAAISFSWDKQINFIVPWATRTDGAAVPVCVTFDGATTCIQASTTVAVPGAFPCDVNTGLTCAINQNGTTNAFSAPEKPGNSVALYMTGFGKVGGTLVDGGVYVAESRPLLGELTASTEPPPTGGCGLFACASQAAALQNITIEYSGAAPGLALGVNQVNLKIPADTPDGLLPVTLSFKPNGQETSVKTVVRVYVKK